MSRNARLLDADEPAPGLLRAGLAAAAGAALRRPAVAGGATAFVVALSFVAANALWYQPHPHGGAFFATRPGASGLERPLRTVAAPQPAAPQAARRDAEPLPVPAPPPDRRETTGAVPPPPEQAASEAARAEAPAGDATVRAVQQVLGKLALYKGPVDGLSGPMTQSAIESYQRAVGLSVTGQIDTALLRHLGLEDAVAAPRDEP
ncbi:peptidoglycan-binding protein, partial [Aquibium sp. A9E412]|uniref:peptidoglycan-binding domain-containing protein n=1 Tax=Aquibium sp. A9E412 TaxID=2976767 RepID=UPI0025AFF945